LGRYGIKIFTDSNVCVSCHVAQMWQIRRKIFILPNILQSIKVEILVQHAYKCLDLQLDH
jgi:hypothetical protein